MRKIIFSLFLSSLALTGFSQAIADASFTDCNNNTRSIYGVLGAGKVLMVANAGTNCGICRGHAPQVQSFAASNTAKIEVWGSMTTKSGGNVNCSDVNSWVSQYNWNNVFAFADLNKEWFVGGTPSFTVVSPVDSTVIFRGNSLSAAQNAASSLAAVLSVEEEALVNGITVLPNAINLSLNTTRDAGQAQLFDITGKLIQTWLIAPGVAQAQLDLKNYLTKGIYVLRITAGTKDVVEKIAL